MKAWISRALLVFATAITLLAGTATVANAADTVLIYWQSAQMVGSIRHIDDGDNFEVCDLRADGHGVTGLVYIPGGGGLGGPEDDGGDAGCDTFHYDVQEGVTYVLEIRWNAPSSEGGGKAWKYFTE
ncbi:hypothetical protein ACIBL3_46585 [Kribbella sp. NPDC050124]|uniref:hypothetical protein n=1 Tax=Kribbella sp. NPDC050124 TaxID=3364114 RepID=UPI0037A9E004